ncbi:MAG TPA: class I SAM-dependent methyltransferase, partial [Pseudonocardia sp.]|nr:class I SAM-dependent methyltransferase [Pseudonocardia sp.]
RAARVYRPLAEQLVAAAPHPLRGRLVLDAGAGTGLVGEALAARGARVVALDRSHDMLAWRAGERPPAAVGEIGHLPLATASVDDAAAAFVLNHLPDPAPALRELRRVTRPGGTVLASVYATSFTSPIRDRIDEVAFAHGFTYPEWYRTLKAEHAPLLGTVERMTAAARAAGLDPVAVAEYTADLGLDRAEDVVDYRLGQAHCARWLAALSPARRADVRAAAVAAIEPIMQPFRPGVIRLVARRP